MMVVVIELLLFFFWMSSAWAVYTDVDLTEDYTFTPDVTISQFRYHLKGVANSVIVPSGVTLDDVKILCERPPGGAGDGVRVTGDDVFFRTVEVRGCEQRSVYVTGDRFRYWAGEIAGLAGLPGQGVGILLDGAYAAEIWGVLLLKPWDGIKITNGSHYSVVVGTAVRTPRSELAIFVDGLSEWVQILRSRGRYNNARFEVTRSDSLSQNNMCERIAGFAACYGNTIPPSQMDYGNPDDFPFQPRWRLICTNASFEGNPCQYNDPAVAIAASNAGDKLLVDTLPGGGAWPAVALNKPFLRKHGNTTAQAGTYSSIVKFQRIDLCSEGTAYYDITVLEPPGNCGP